MKFLGLGIGLYFKRKEPFSSIRGYSDIKDIITRALDSEDSINILLWGDPSSSKTMFLMELAKEKGTVYFDGSNTTTTVVRVIWKQ